MSSIKLLRGTCWPDFQLAQSFNVELHFGQFQRNSRQIKSENSSSLTLKNSKFVKFQLWKGYLTPSIITNDRTCITRGWSWLNLHKWIPSLRRKNPGEMCMFSELFVKFLKKLFFANQVPHSKKNSPLCVSLGHWNNLLLNLFR